MRDVKLFGLLGEISISESYLFKFAMFGCNITRYFINPISVVCFCIGGRFCYLYCNFAGWCDSMFFCFFLLFCFVCALP